MEEITQLISNVGFPIVACIFMFKQQSKFQQTLTDLATTLKSIDARISTIEK